MKRVLSANFAYFFNHKFQITNGSEATHSEDSAEGTDFFKSQIFNLKWSAATPLNRPFRALYFLPTKPRALP